MSRYSARAGRGSTLPHMGDFDALVPVEDDSATVDGQREVAFGELADDLLILPDHTVDDTDAGWGELSASNDERLLADRPPHWG
jgi:hypothetical protein